MAALSSRLLCLVALLTAAVASAEDDVASLRESLKQEAERSQVGASACGCTVPVEVAFATFPDAASLAKASDAISNTASGVGKVCDDDSSRKKAICKGLTKIIVEHSATVTAPTMKNGTLVVFSGPESFTNYEEVHDATLAVSRGADPATWIRPRPVTAPGPEPELRAELDNDAYRISGLLLERCDCLFTVTIDWSFEVTQELRTPISDVLSQIYNGTRLACPEPSTSFPVRTAEESKLGKAKICARLSKFFVRRASRPTPPAFDGATMIVSFDRQRIYDPGEVGRPIAAMVAAPLSGKLGGEAGRAPAKGGAIAGTNGPNGMLDDVSGTIVWQEDATHATIWVDGKKVGDETLDEQRASTVEGKVPDGVAKLANGRLGVVGTAKFKKGARQGPTVVLANGEVSTVLDYDRGVVVKERRYFVGLSSDQVQKVEGGTRGPLEWEGSYLGGVLDGVVKTFWQNGAVSWEETWQQGTRAGERRFFDQGGKSISASEWRRLARPVSSSTSPADEAPERPSKKHHGSGTKGSLCRGDEDCMSSYRCVRASRDAPGTGHCR